MRHTFQCHSSTPNFLYPCGISGCIQTFKTFSSICSHLQRKHPHCDVSQLEVCTDGTNTGHEETGQEEGQEEAVLRLSGEDVNDSDEEITDDGNNSHLLMQKSTALLLLTLKERHKLTQTAINFSVGQIKQMIFHVFEDVKISIRDRLRDIDVGEVDIDQCFDIDPFQGLDTQYSQSRFYREHFNLIVSFSSEIKFVFLCMHVYN